MNKYKIMLVDDEPDILDLLDKALTIEGYCNITKIDNGLSAINTCKEINPDIIVLDVMLPDIDGYEVCKKIREISHCPILFLSSKNDELDKILGLAVGGDDYVTKPFSPKEIAYRVKAQLRRAEYKYNPKQDFSVRIGELMIDADGCRVMKNNKEIELTAREFEILQYLAQNVGRVISRERLYETVWGEDSFGCDNTIMVHIRHLREKLEDNPTAPQYIITIYNLTLFLLPYRATIPELGKYISYQFGGLVLDTFSMRVIVYAALTVITLPLARLGFKKHQVA